MSATGQRVTISGLALASGIMISVGVSPLGTFAAELSQLTQYIPESFPSIIDALLSLETALALAYGAGTVWDSGGLFALLSFTVAFIAGALVLYTPRLTAVLIPVAWLFMLASPVDRWGRYR